MTDAEIIATAKGNRGSYCILRVPITAEQRATLTLFTVIDEAQLTAVQRQAKPCKVIGVHVGEYKRK